MGCGTFLLKKPEEGIESDDISKVGGEIFFEKTSLWEISLEEECLAPIIAYPQKTA